MELNLKQYIMEPRQDWNLIGPRLPAWFRVRLARIDPSLVLQFIPSDDYATGGVPASKYPWGVWIICRRMRASRWLFKRWIWNLAGPGGEYLAPGPDTIQLIRRARNLWRRGDLDLLDRKFDDSIEALKREKVTASKQRLLERLAGLCRKFEFVRHNQVFFPSMNSGAVA